MPNFRCIKCENLWDQGNFGLHGICEKCEKNNTDTQIACFSEVFSKYCIEIFYLRYPAESHLISAEVPSGHWERKKLIKTKKESIEEKIKENEEEKKEIEKRIKEMEKEKLDCGGVERQRLDYYIRDDNLKCEILTAYLDPLKAQRPYIVQFEKQYK